MTPPRARSTTPTRSYNLRSTPARTAHYAKHPNVEPPSIRARRQARPSPDSPPTPQSLSPPSPPNSPIRTSSQPSSSIASPPTLGPQDDDDDHPLTQLHPRNPIIPPTLSPISPTQSSTQTTTQTLHNIPACFQQPFRILPAPITPDRTPAPSSPLVLPSQPPRLPPDPHTASALADTLTSCHITSPPQLPQVQPQIPTPLSVAAPAPPIQTPLQQIQQPPITSSQPLLPLSFIPSPITQPESPIDYFDMPEPQAFPRLVQPYQIRPRIFLSTNPPPRPSVAPSPLFPTPLTSLYPTISRAARPTISPFAALDASPLPPQPSPIVPPRVAPTPPPPVTINSSRSSMDESSDFHSNSLPQSRPEIPSIAPRTPEPLVHTPPTPPTPSSADPPTPQSNPRVNSITTRATLRTPVRDSRSPSTPSRSATDRSYSPLSRYVQTPELYLPRIPTARQRRLDNDQRMLLYFSYMLTDAIAPPLEDICRMIRLQCGHYIGSMITDIIDSIPNPLITPCVHLLFAYHFLEPEVLDVTNDIHAQLVPYVLRVVTSLSYLIHVTIPCGILAPLYSFMIDHRWTRSFNVFISTFSHMFILLCETLQTLHDEFIAPPGHTSFSSVLDFYQNFIHHELRHLQQHYNLLFARRTPNRGDTLSFPDINQSPHFTDEQIQSVYIPHLAPQRTTIDDVALFSTISSPYVGPDLTHFYRPDYTLHVLPDRNPRTDVPFTPPAQQQPAEPDTQAQPASTPHIEQTPLPQAVPPSPITIYSSSDTNMATAEGGSLPDESSRVITPQLGPANSPAAAESPSTTPPLPAIAEATTTTDTTILATTARPPPGFPHSTVADAIRQTARDAVTQQLRTVTEQQTKTSNELT